LNLAQFPQELLGWRKLIFANLSLPMVDKVHCSLVLKEHKMEPALPLG
jgi:hypothetical protein